LRLRWGRLAQACPTAHVTAARIVIAVLLSASFAFGQYRRGVNVAGAEFGEKNLPGVFGRDYTFNSEATFRYFGEKGLGLARIPLRWERLQPALGGPLEGAYLGRLKSNVAWAKAHGVEVILDIHNFGRYSIEEAGALREYVIDNPSPDGSIRVSAADLADLWRRLSSEFKFEGAVYAYDLMNEPHDMGPASWKTISQTVLDAIRANQDDKLVLIPGDSWSSANRWASTHGPWSWIRDPANNFAYEAHQYFDRDESGSYKLSYDDELAKNSGLADLGRKRVQNFIDWTRNNNVRGVVDEYGIPAGDPRWAAVLENFFEAVDAAGMDGAYWAAGEWWGNYALSVQPTSSFTQDRPQMANLLAHAGRGYLTALSAASGSVARATAGSLVSLYGSGFTEATAQAPGVPYPLALADITVLVTDSSGASAAAGLVYVSPGQINLQMPPDPALGRATFTVLRGSSQVASGTMQVAATGPAVFTANSAGYGVAAAHVIRVKPDGSQTWEPVAQLDPTQPGFIPAPIDFGDPADRLFLALYGTGIRGSAAAIRVAGQDLPVLYAGPQYQYPGLDQANVELPRTLAGAGPAEVTLTLDTVPANTVAILFR
jgi:endoglucanase